jgi:outer membrane receptor protein involved in Fe transport
MRQVKASDFRVRKLMAALLGLGILPSWATAIAADDEQLQNLQTVVVTAQKRVQTEFDVPASVSSIDAAGLSNSGLFRLEDFAAQVPGLSVTSSTAGQNQVTIRGITTGSVQSAPTTGIYLDEAPIGSVNAYTHGSTLVPDLDPAELSRIEVLKGPQGTLYGSNALGGILRYVTRPPDFTELSGSVTVGGASIDHGGNGGVARLYVNVPFAANTMALQLSGFDRYTPGFIDDANGRKNVNDAHTSGGHLVYTWAVSDDWKVAVSALTHRVTSNDSNTEDVDAKTLHPLHGSLTQNVLIAQPSKSVLDLYNVTLHGKVAFFDLVSSTTYQTVNFNATSDATDEYGALLGGLLHIPNLGVSLSQRTETDRWSEELRLDARALDDKLFYQVGGYFTKENDVNEVPGLNPFSAQTLAPITLPFYFLHAILDTNYHEYSGFANATYNFTPQFSLQGGVRYSEDHQSYSQNYSGLLEGPKPVVINDARERGNKTTYLGTASYKLTTDNAVYLRVATGYRAGGPNATPPPTIYVAPTTFAPDSLTSYEVGYKSVMAGGKVSLEAAIFKTDWKDIQIETSQAGYKFFANGGTATSKGAEATLLVNPFAGFTVRASAAYTDAYLTADAPAAMGVRGDELPFVPKYTASLGSSYRCEVGRGWATELGGSVDYTGSRRSDYSGRDPVGVPPYTTVNVTGSLESDHWRFTVYGRNLNDREGITSLAQRTLVLGVNPYSAAIIQPRTLGIEANFRF